MSLQVPDAKFLSSAWYRTSVDVVPFTTSFADLSGPRSATSFQNDVHGFGRFGRIPILSMSLHPIPIRDLYRQMSFLLARVFHTYFSTFKSKPL